MRGLLVALVVILAGCSGLVGGGPSTAESPKPTSTPETPAGNTLLYSDLSEVEQRAFDAAVTDQANFVRNSTNVVGDYFDSEHLQHFRTHDYLRKDGTTYALSINERSHRIASYHLELASAESPDNATVARLRTLPIDVRQPVRWAIQNGSYTTPFGKWAVLPDSLQGVEYVRAGNQTYRFRVAVGDGWAQELVVE